MTQKQFNIYIGHNVNNKPRWNSGDIMYYVNYGCGFYGIENYSVCEITGFYKGKSEDTTEVIICGVEETIINSFAKMLKEYLFQECVLVTSTNIEMTFVD